MARGSPGRVRRHGDQQPVDLGRVLRRLPRRARRLAAAALAPQPRPALPALADRVALVLQPRRRLHGGAALLSAARLGRRCAGSWIGVTGPRHGGRAALAGLGAARRHDLPRRLPRRAQRPGSNVIDVGYSGVIGARADREGTGAVGELPRRETTEPKPCGPADASGEIRDWIQTNGRCESREPGGRHVRAGRVRVVHPRLSAILGWSGKWDDLPAAHFTSIAFDLLTLLGLFLVGLRFGGQRLGAVLAFAWAAYPFTQYVSNSNTNDAIMPCFLVCGFWLVSTPAARGVLRRRSRAGRSSPRCSSRRCGSTYPGRRPVARLRARLRRSPRSPPSRSCCSSRTRCTRLHVFWTRTVGFQIGRDRRSRSGTGGSTTRAGCPTSTSCSASCRGCSSLGAVAVAFFPRRKSPLQLAALTAVLLAGFELVADVLALHVHPVVLPLRRDRPARAGAAARAGSSRSQSGDADELDRLSLPGVGARDEDALQPHVAFGGLEPDG